ncbi:hypothetical protein ADJ70_07135 [Olsenella sp. oral taxon 807]|nr:hypothetical protein ADJ70_07135 [Olsenella sp. oral taxon 807]
MRAQVARRGHAGPSLSGPQVGDAADRPGGGDWAWEVAAHRVGDARTAGRVRARAPHGRLAHAPAHPAQRRVGVGPQGP